MNELGETQLDTIVGKIQDETGGCVVKKYSKGRFLGKGGFAKCYEFKDLDTGKILAAKIIDKLSLAKERSKQKLASEINIHKSLKHPGVVRFENNFEDGRNVYILLELCPNQTLKELVKRRKKLTELEAQYYLGQLIPTLIYLHKSNIIHRDIKLGNLFLGKNMELKIGDFGLAAKLTTPHERRKTVCGTPNYIAPEILNTKRDATGQTGHSFEVDIWAVGIILYTMLIGKPPFESSNVKLTYKKIRANEYVIPPEIALSPEAIELIKKILIPAPERRPKLEEIMNDPFMTKNAIPKAMPLSTLSCVPSPTYLSQYVKVADEVLNGAENANVENVENVANVANAKEGGVVEVKVKSTEKSDICNSSGNLKLKESNVNNNLIATAHEAFVRTLGHSSSNKFPVDAIEKNETLASKETRPVTSTASSPVTVTLQDPFQPVFVHSYADYTDRYGVGYILTNGIMGFFYNDLSNILLLHHKNQYAYADMYGRKERSTDAVLKRYKVSDYPKEIDKKIRIFGHFKQWCESNSKKDSAAPLSPLFFSPTDSDETVSVKKIVKTNSGLLFRLNNHLIQMCFTDKSQMIVSFRARQLISINKKGERQSYKVNSQLFHSSNENIVQRIKYVIHLVNTLNSVHTRGMAPSSSAKLKTFRLNSHK